MEIAATQMEFLWGPTGGAERQKWRRKVGENVGTLGRDSEYLILHRSRR